MNWIVLLLLLLVVPARAHPVAQGSLNVLVHEDRITVEARVSTEEAFVEQGFSKGAAASSKEEIWARHGAYILQHLRLEADGKPLDGRVVRVTPPANAAPSSLITYDLEFATASPTAALVLRQDVLNEFEFAPGNPWEATFVVTLGQAGHTTQSGLLFTRKAPLTLACQWSGTADPSGETRIDRGRMFVEYLRHGVMHILTGYDHLLFMAGLVLAVTSLLDLVKVVTAFTLAHTVTLTLSVLNIFRLPSTIVEPMIAASIVFVAVQNVFWPSQTRGWGRLALAFGFGLFHGLGFAGGLLDAMAGLPGIAVATAIVAFSIGVEIGHQAVVLPLFFGLLPFRRRLAPDDTTLMPIARFASAWVAFAGMYYLVVAVI